jgi:transcription factor TFIIIB component B''
VQVIDGQIVINDSSLTVQAQESTVGSYVRVEEDKRLINSFTYMRKGMASAKWSEHDTEAFYAALQAFGTNFGMMAQVRSSPREQQRCGCLLETVCEHHIAASTWAQRF